MALASKRGLGRGLAALIPEDTFSDMPDVDVRGELLRIPIEEIQPNPEQPRTQFDAQALSELASSIKVHGIMSPLVVRKHRGSYILIAGERRLRAAGLAGLFEVPCVVRTADSPQQQLELALIENLLREDLDPIEAAIGYRRLASEFGLSHSKIAERVGLNRATVANAIRLLQHPEWMLERVQTGRLTAGHGRALLPMVRRETVLRELADRCEAEGWSVRQVERAVQRINDVGEPETDSANAPSMDYATEVLEKALQTGVRIQSRKRGGGQIILSFSDAEELDRLIDHIRRGSSGR